MAKLTTGKCLCLKCGFGEPNWYRNRGGVSYPICSICGRDAISWHHLTSGLSQMVSTEDWKQLQERYPEIIQAAEQFE